jgi:hypothetical protein
MEMPDEKQSGIYGIKKGGFEDDELVESMALDEPKAKPSLNPVSSISALGGAKI